MKVSFSLPPLVNKAFAVLFLIPALSACKGVVTDATIQPAPKVGVIWTAPSNIPYRKKGYELKEYFFQGVANSYSSDQPLTSDGKWSIEASGETAEYMSRMIVYRPEDSAAFNGTVIVEWMNVSGGTDTPTEWFMTQTELMRQGYAYVGVSAQYMGVEGGPNALPSVAPLCLSVKCIMKPRYGSLVHPGDSFSYDIYWHAAELVRNPQEVNPLGELVPQYVIGAGQSQSAHRLISFLNSFGHDFDGLFDGFFIHSRLGSGIPELGGGGSAPLSQSPQADINTPVAVQIRDDLTLPVLNLQTETDQITLNAGVSRQPDTSMFRLWEVAGSAHADLYVSSTALFDTGETLAAAKMKETRSPIPVLTRCKANINSAPQHHFVSKAAIRALNDWVVTGIAPASKDRLEINEDGTAFIVDAFGNALGGIRSPYTDVPIARMSGLNQDTRDRNGLCFLYGSLEKFDAEKLKSLYSSSANYVSLVEAAVDRAIDDGTLLAEDAHLIISAAQELEITNLN